MADTGFGERARNLAAFVGFGAEDAALVRESRDVLLPHAAAIVDAVYDHLLAYPATAPFFTSAGGHPDSAFLTKRKETLAEWLAATLDASLDDAFATYIARVGEAHRVAGVPPTYVAGTISFAQTALAGILSSGLNEALPSIQAWNKFLMVQLDLMLSPYERAAA